MSRGGGSGASGAAAIDRETLTKDRDRTGGNTLEATTHRTPAASVAIGGVTELNESMTYLGITDAGPSPALSATSSPHYEIFANYGPSHFSSMKYR